MRIVRFADVAATPWKNGGGVTRELLRLPASSHAGGAGDWRLRLSVADIDADGPFSPFDGVARSFAVLAGAGVRLAWPDGRVRVLDAADAALDFDGGDPPHCTLAAGPTRDLNLMVARGAAIAHLERAEMTTPRAPGGAHRGVLALRPLVVEHAGARHALGPLDLAWRDEADPAPWALHVDADAAATNAQNAGSGAPHAWWIACRLEPDAPPPAPR